ncbi:MAG: threonine/serine dehydratase [Bacillota bacterium]
MLKREDFLDARDALRGVTEPTPLQYSATFSRYTGHRIWVKPENLQKVGAFKTRGAYNRLRRMTPAQRERGVITGSSGNHAAALAWAASQFDARCIAVMPEDAPESKQRAVRGYGAEITLHGRYSDERKRLAREMARELDMTYVDSTDDEDIMAGQGTCALEIIEEMPDVDVIVGPIGGGGLLAGVSRVVALVRPGVSVIGVEPEGSCSMYQSVRAGRPVSVQIDTVADGLRIPRPGELPFSYVSRHVDSFHQVSEDQITDSLLLILERMKLLTEPSGAVSLAGVLDGAVPDEGKRVVAILSGGNVDSRFLGDLIRRGLQIDWGPEMRP